jgi:hypothetical protein
MNKSCDHYYIAQLKKRLETHRVPPYTFFRDFYAQFSLDGYCKFLKKLHYDEIWTPQMESAMVMFDKVYE